MKSEVKEAVDMIVDQARALSVSIDERQSDKLARFLGLLENYNEHTNLVSSAKPSLVAVDHVLDSLSLASVLQEYWAGWKQSNQPRLIDIGTGAGFPGLILAMVLDQWHFTLVDSTAKKTCFVQEVVDDLNLVNVIVLTDRVEELAHQGRYRESFGFATARAVGAGDISVELGLPLLSLGGLMILQKTAAQLDRELKITDAACSLLGGFVEKPVSLDANVLGKDRALILITKKERTKDKYPRAWKKIKESPLSSV